MERFELTVVAQGSQSIWVAVLVVALVKPVGRYMTDVFMGERTFLTPVLRPLEVGFYRLSGVDERTDQHWVTYAVAMLLFNLAGRVTHLEHSAKKMTPEYRDENSCWVRGERTEELAFAHNSVVDMRLPDGKKKEGWIVGAVDQIP